jgi:hypothetical protein
MFYVIESESHINELFETELNLTDDIFIQVILSQPNTHIQVCNKISLIYLYQINTNKGYVLCVNHNESFSINIKCILEYLNKYNTIYCLNRPLIYQTIPELKPKLVDLSIVYWLNSGKNIKLVETTCHYYYEKNIGKYYNNINEIIPISKHYEILEEFKNKHIYSLVTQYKNINKKIYKYYLLLQDTLTLIESNPIGIDRDKLDKYFSPNNESYSIIDNRLYTKYHFFTLTSRPQNYFNNINFNSLSKDNNCRESFVPLNDIFIEIDFNAYHVQLLSQLIGYKFDLTKNIYDQLLDEYSKINPNINTREESKKITIIQLNSGVLPKYQNIEFFVKYNEFVEKLWNEYNTNNNVIDPITGRNIVYLRSDIGKYKLISYMLQSYETSNNIRILYSISKKMSLMKSKIVLYNYDSFLIDADREEFNEIINNILPLINQNIYITNISTGSDYNNLKKLK